MFSHFIVSPSSPQEKNIQLKKKTAGLDANSQRMEYMDVILMHKAQCQYLISFYIPQHLQGILGVGGERVGEEERLT